MFVSYITIYSGDKLPPLYIGSTTKNKISNGYCGSISSIKWKSIYLSEMKNNSHLFDTIILDEFDSRRDALASELYWQRRHDVVRSGIFFNEAFAVIDGFFGRDVSNENNPRFGVVMDDATKNKISKANKENNLVVVSDDGGDTWHTIKSNIYYNNKSKYITPRGEFNPNTTDATRHRVKNGTHHFCDVGVQQKIQDKRKSTGWTHSTSGLSRISNAQKGKDFWLAGIHQKSYGWLYCLELHTSFEKKL